MDSEQRPDVPAGFLPRRFVPFLVVTVLAALGATAAWALWRASVAPGTRPGTVAARGLDDEAARSPYANVRPGVRYVGDAACARCHQDIADSFRKHPMGRSLVPVAAVPGPQQEGWPGDQASFPAQGFEYNVQRRGDRLIHKETRRDARGRTLTEVEGEVRYIVGSGSRALSYLVEHDGYLFESPISWYAQARRWDLSPSYETENWHFERAISDACLFCHTNRVHDIEGTLNRYREPIFEGYAIGCERCHGPGELHAQQPLARPGAAPNIVNPADLEPPLREAVCQQCHLQGDVRVVRAGRAPRDYRPGLPLHAFVSVFVKAATSGRKRFFGQVEQMQESRCYRASGGALGCIACHDPHRQPEPAEKVAYYRDRCLECHARRGCKLPRPERLVRSASDSCIACHMPRSPSTEVRHTATTAHSIPRFAGRDEPAAVPQGSPPVVAGSLVHFHGGLVEPEERGEVERDLGVALVLKARELTGRSSAEECLRALPLLEAALAARPDDVHAWWALGDASTMLGLRAEGLEAFRAALKLVPQEESALVGSAELLTQLGRRREALDAWRRVLELDPWRSDYHHSLGLVRFEDGDWPAAAAACRAALRLNPSDVEARMLLVDCYLKMGRKAEARDEFQVVLSCDPPDRDAKVRWFASQQ